jgi:hypothetical protein
MLADQMPGRGASEAVGVELFGDQLRVGGVHGDPFKVSGQMTSPSIVSLRYTGIK